MISDISPLIIEKSAPILAEIHKATSILLHCHPSPDPDSVGSALATKFVLESMGKKVTVIKGDSHIPEAFMHFPGATEIVQKNFFEIDVKEFDLFIILDSGSVEQISRLAPFPMPVPIPTIVIDHHISNKGYGSLVNLIEPSYPATAQILFDLYTLWDIEITQNIAANLFMGIYTDTGGFKYAGTTLHTFESVRALVRHVPKFPKLISDMENSNTPADIAFQALALSSIETFFEGKLALSVVSYASIMAKGIPLEDAQAHAVSPALRRVKGWPVTGVLVEQVPGIIKLSFRSKDAHTYDISLLAAAFGGGGHKAAAGSVFKGSIEDAKNLVVAKAKELYNL
jgi:bifunctional oligoribonuclease and PAP phosphatase NrnA